MLFRNRFRGQARVARSCSCPVSLFGRPGSEQTPELHLDPQDENGEAWRQLLALIDEAAESGVTGLTPGLELGPELWPQIVTLPPTIARLTELRELSLYGSNLRSLPPQIGQLRSLTNFVPYTSYRLHWFPYEITRCAALVDSTVSTRALYGNHKHRPAFPELPVELPPELTPDRCSVCDGAFADGPMLQRWTSATVATDILPLLVHACSEDCLGALPAPPAGYHPSPHRGGGEVVPDPATL